MKEKFFRYNLILLSFLMLTFLFTIPALPEQITITTYYPAPFGVYKELRAESVSIGSGYLKDAIPANGLIVEGNVGIGTATPQIFQDARTINLDVTENIVAKDVYLDNPGSGNPRWASECGGSLGSNCAWTPWSTCTAWQTSNELFCPAGAVVSGYQRAGCSGPGCDDSTRCEKTRIYCCGQ